MIHALISWLERTPASLTVQTVFWIIPVVQTIHILAVSMVMASMAMLDLRLMGLIGSDRSIAASARQLMPWMWAPLVALLISGMVLIIGEPGRSLGNWVFQIKMSLLLTAVIASLTFSRRLQQSPAPRLLTRLFGLTSLLLWVGIVVCGRWIAYAG